MAIDPQQTLDHSDLMIGRLTRALDSAYSTVAQARAMIKERDDSLQAKDEEIEKHLARVSELEAIIEDLADEDDDESDEDHPLDDAA